MRRRVIVLIATSILAGCGLADPAPPNAQLFADPETHLIVSPPCLAANPKAYASYTLRITDADVRAAFQDWKQGKPARPYWPEARCHNRRFERPGFSPAGSSGGFTESRLPFQKSTRWNPDGSWRW